MGALSISIAPASLALEAEWRALEERAERSFFLSWIFVATAIEIVGSRLLCARICDGETVVGLALLWPVVEKRHGAFKIRQLRLNEYGADAFDTVPSEYTSVLAAPGYKATAFPALIDALAARNDWDELIVTNLLETDEAQLASLGLKIHRRAESGSGVVDLDALRASGVVDLGGYLQTLGKSTRGAIARSVRLYSERGKLRLERAHSTEDGLAWFAEIAAFQTAKWRARGRPGMNDQTFIKAFNERLIANALPQGKIEILRLTAGSEPVAWLFNLIDRRKALFYVGGFSVSNDNRLKPGLVAHAMAIADHLKSGASVYDFMAGDDRYKTNLGAPGPNFISVALQRPRLVLQLEDALRVVKNRLAPQASSQPQTDAT